MSTPVPRSRYRDRRLVALAVLVVGVGIAVWQVTAYYRLEAYRDRAVAALERGEPEAARPELDHYLKDRPHDPKGHFLAARAARQCGELSDARRHLEDAHRLGWPAAEVQLERALIAVQSGRVSEGERIALQAVAQNHPQSAHILSVLVPVYFFQFRMAEAGALTAKWVELQPESARAWGYHADAMERLGRKEVAVEALRKLVGLTPEDARTRLALARLLLEVRQSVDEAAGHLEWLEKRDGDNPAVLLQLALCREAQGRPDEAVAVLDRLIGKVPRDARVQYHRGRLELARGRAADALPSLRKAAELDPSDPEALFSLVQCLQRVGTPEQVREAEEKWKRAEADRKRAGELIKAIASAPADPDLRRELGELRLRGGRDEDGVRWLESALQLQPHHVPTHRVLAAYYERTGKPDLAARHRAFLPP